MVVALDSCSHVLCTVQKVFDAVVGPKWRGNKLDTETRTMLALSICLLSLQRDTICQIRPVLPIRNMRLNLN